ncbi:gypsy retrotransposon integrase-like protein [Trifolium medium]|uniref:Gypsy retrotransposon integrase-like protein n=1 Tax=Trifolium medium TaxID=97028 RepID=A0A392M221_9FABA|nr:gypsy retrotransposon integrase-like protein [Trifolium medium]
MSIPLLKCLAGREALTVLQEVHEGIAGQHLGGRALTKKVLRAGYYWPSMGQDAKDFVKKCEKCQLKYLIVDVDYCTKWVEAEALAKITAANVIKFFKRNILAGFGVPQSVVTDNGSQFIDRKIQQMMENFKIKQQFSSVEHPQTNGQAKAANRVILRGLKRRLDDAKGNWAEELHHILWAYRTTPHSSTGETPFRLTYGTEAVILVELEELSWRTAYPLQEEDNSQAIHEDQDILDET